jgi:hypothetical protein
MARSLFLVAAAVLATAGCSAAGVTPVPPTGVTPATPSGDTGASSAAPVRSQASLARCHTGELKASLGKITGNAETQSNVPLTFTNIGKTACRMRGFPGVDLVGADVQPWGPTYSLPRTTDKPTTVVLPPGGSVSAIVTFLWGEPGDSNTWFPAKLVTTPPDETTSLTVPWPAKTSVMRQDAATHPGTYVGAVGAKPSS